MMKIILFLIALLFSFNAMPEESGLEYLERNKEIIKSEFSKFDIAVIVSYKALKNTYLEFCKKQPKQDLFKFVHEIYWIEYKKRMDELSSLKWDVQYHIHKKYLKKFRKKVNISFYCSCVLENMFGKTNCLEK